MIFTTARLKIRKALPTEEDVEMYFRLWTDPRVMTNVGYPHGIAITREKMRQMLETQGQSEFNHLLVIERRSDGQRLGECALHPPDENGIAGTDVKLLPAYWGHAYGVEVKRGLLDYLFTHTDCHAVRASPNVNNRPSIRMQEAVGGQRIEEFVYEFPEHITVQIKPASELSPDEHKRINYLLERVFGDDPYNSLSYAKMEWNVLIYVGKVLASNVEIVQRTVTVDGQPLLVGGIGGVATLPEYRGRGLATRGMTAGVKFMKDELSLEYGLLITGSRRRTFYEGMGWQVIPEPAYFDQPTGKKRNEGLTMSLSMANKSWPPGAVDFCGLPW
jgi:RimJ/RimL family protein N-acetyltransferase